MTVTLHQLALYAGGMFVLFLVPGPVWVALIARALAGGFNAAWPLAVGVAIGDLVWPLCAIFGLSWVLSVYGGFLEVLRWVASGIFVFMGVALIRKPAEAPGAPGRMTRPGMKAGFLVGLAAVFGNPKAILFYMGVLPGFFDLSRITGADIVAILAVSMAVPMLGNLALALSLDRVRRLLTSPESLRRINVISGCLMLVVAAALPFT